VFFSHTTVVDINRSGGANWARAISKAQKVE
jgi:hypothetical protein